MEWMNRVAELTGYAVLFITVFGICGATAAWVNDLIRKHNQDPYSEYAWSRDLPRHNSMWDQLQQQAPLAPAEAGDPGETPGA